MFARLAWGKVKPGTWDDYERIYHEEILPATRDVKGLSLRELLQQTRPTLWLRIAAISMAIC